MRARRMLGAAAALAAAAALLAGCLPPDDGLLQPEDLVTEPCSAPDHLPVDELLARYPAPLDCDLNGMVLVFADGAELEVSDWLSRREEADGTAYAVANLQRHGLAITTETAEDGIEWLGHPGAVALWRSEFDRIDP